MNKFALDTKIQGIEDIADAPIEDELVLMSTEHGKYYSMNMVGSDIWQFIKKPITVKELFAKMADLYEVENVNYQDQIIDFLNVLDEKKLLKFVD